MWRPPARAARRLLASQILETVEAALLPGAAGRIVPPPDRLVSCRDAFCARRSSCTQRTASAVAAYKIRLTRASRGWRLRGPRPRWSRGPRASYSAASGRLKDLTRRFCLIECRGRGVRGSLEGPNSSWVEGGSVLSFPTRLRTRVECTRTLTRRRLTVPRPGRLAECRNDQERLPDDAAPSRGRKRTESHLFP